MLDSQFSIQHFDKFVPLLPTIEELRIVAMLFADLKSIFGLSTIPPLPPQEQHLIQYIIKEKINIGDMFTFDNAKEINYYLLHNLLETAVYQTNIKYVPFDVIGIALAGFYEDEHK